MIFIDRYKRWMIFFENDDHFTHSYFVEVAKKDFQSFFLQVTIVLVVII